MADRLGIKITGLLGILVEAKRKKLIVAVKPLIDALITPQNLEYLQFCTSGFWMWQTKHNSELISCTYWINPENSNKDSKNITVDKPLVLSNTMLLIELNFTVGSRL